MLFTNGKKAIEIVKTAELFTIGYDIDTGNVTFYNQNINNIIQDLLDAGYKPIKNAKRVIIQHNGKDIVLYVKKIDFTGNYAVITTYNDDVVAYSNKIFNVYIKGV